MIHKNIFGMLLKIFILTVLGLGVYQNNVFAEVTVEASAEAPVPNQSISTQQSFDEMWEKTSTNGRKYKNKFMDWYHSNNTTIQIIPEIARVQKLDFVLTILGILFSIWLSLKFLFFRQS
jgi:uncharacterized membrane protein